MELNYKNDTFLFGEYDAENFININNLNDKNWKALSKKRLENLILC